MLGAGRISKESHLWYSLAMSKYYHECHLCQLCFHNYMAHHIYTNHEMKAAFPKHTKHHWDQRQHHFSFSSSLSKPLHKLLLLQSSWIMSMISSTRYSDAFTSLQTWPTWVKTCSSTVNQVDIKHSLAPNIVPYGIAQLFHNITAFIQTATRQTSVPVSDHQPSHHPSSSALDLPATVIAFWEATHHDQQKPVATTVICLLLLIVWVLAYCCMQWGQW